jgi:predicted  nucleic acid-binding Zn-ribbon protein
MFCLLLLSQETACNEEIARLRGKSSSLKKKVRRANEEEKREKLRISALDKEISELEEKLALKLQEIPRPIGGHI